MVLTSRKGFPSIQLEFDEYCRILFQCTCRFKSSAYPLHCQMWLICIFNVTNHKSIKRKKLFFLLSIVLSFSTNKWLWSSRRTINFGFRSNVDIFKSIDKAWGLGSLKTLIQYPCLYESDHKSKDQRVLLRKLDAVTFIS